MRFTRFTRDTFINDAKLEDETLLRLYFVYNPKVVHLANILSSSFFKGFLLLDITFT